MKMIKQGHLRQMSIVFIVLTFGSSLLLSACAGNAGSTNTGDAPVAQRGTYNSPSWWNGKDCNKGNYPSAYDLLGYNKSGNPITWQGIEVCGPLPGLNSTGPT